jgi:predicted HicB family RNase H-like nuclease
VQGIDDSITFEGNSVAKLKRAFKEAIDDYIEICAETDKDPHKSYKGSFNIRIKPELHKKAAYKSLEQGISLNQLVERALMKYLRTK